MTTSIPQVFYKREESHAFSVPHIMSTAVQDEGSIRLGNNTSNWIYQKDTTSNWIYQKEVEKQT
jgi:hypothetical protein